MPDGVCADTLHDAELVYAVSCLADLIGEIRLPDDPAPDAGAASSESCLVDLLGKLNIANESAFDMESIGSTDPMLVDSDTTSLDAFPTNVVIIDDPVPCADSGGNIVTEVVVIIHDGASGGGAQDPLQAALRDLFTPIAEDAYAETLEARRILLVESAKKLVTMRRLSEAYEREIDCAVGGMPTAGGPSRIGTVGQRCAAVASMFGADRPVYATPMENIRAAQATADELDHLEGDERHYMTERVQ